MIEKTRGIVLRSVNYRDNSVIVHIYTEVFGMQSYLVNGVRNQKGPIRPSHLMPLNLVEMVVYHKENQDLHRIRELKCTPILNEVHFDVVKNSIAMFTTEILNACIHGEEPNNELFEFLFHFVQVLDLEHDKLANYPIAFLLRLSRYLGCYPDSNYEEGFLLQIDDGRFAALEHCHGPTFNRESSALCYEFLKASDWHDVNPSREQRAALLEELIRYYDYHAFHGRKIKSHVVLREVL